MDDDNKKKVDATGQEMLSGMGGLFEGVSNLLGRLSELAEKGQELKRTSQFQSPSGKEGNASYGLSVKFASGNAQGATESVKPINQPVSAKPKAAPIKKAAEDREPQVDVFEEADHLSIIAELPGVTVENVSLEFNGRVMNLIGTTPRVRFSKSIELPDAFGPEDVTVEMNNGVVEIKLKKRV
jgi:HSP20 family protein